MSVAVESNWGVGNFLFGLSLALSNIKENNKANQLYLLESKKCGYDHKRKKIREVSDDFLSIFDPDINLKIVYAKEDCKGLHIYRGFNFQYNLENSKTYIRNVLRYQKDTFNNCNKIINQFKIKDNNYISLNIRGGDFKTYYNNIDERLSFSYYSKIIEILPKNLKIAVSVVPQEDTQHYKKIFKKYDDRLFFVNDYIEYPLCLPILSEAKYCIISNSTFHWWGGFLNKNGKVYYPYPWFKKFNQNMWFPKGWIPADNSDNVSSKVFNNTSKKSQQINHVSKKEEIFDKNIKIKLINKIHAKQFIIVNLKNDGGFELENKINWCWRPIGKDRMIIFDKKTKAKMGEIIKNSISKEYFVSLNVDGRTSATAWIGKEV
jgi:hypothetical protein